MTSPALALDFGTSNSAAAIVANGALTRIAVEQEDTVLPTAVFFPSDGGQMQIGHAATRHLINGDEGRYMRALKSILGTDLFHETRTIEGKRRKLSDVVTAFLERVKSASEAQTGQAFPRALSGRPVRFHSSDAEKDARAEADLRGCYLAAGFDEVDFLYEPIAAAIASRHGTDAPTDGVGLIVDIGGGTSDFTVFEGRGREISIRASHGIRLGGTDFDHAISMAHAMAHLGLGGDLRRSFGEGLLPVPKGIYADLANWAKIPFLYTREVERQVEDMLRHATSPNEIKRLLVTLQEELGHELAFAVERGKIDANTAGAAEIKMGFIETGLTARITTGSMAACLIEARAKLQEAIYASLMAANTPPHAIDHLVLVGGSSLMGMVSDVAHSVCAGARIMRSDAFSAVVDGLAWASARDTP